MLSLSTVLNWDCHTLRLVVAHTPGLQIPKSHCSLSVVREDEGQQGRETRDGEQRRGGQLWDGECSGCPTSGDSAAAWRGLVGDQVGERGRPGTSSKLRGRWMLKGFTVHGGQTSFPGPTDESDANDRIMQSHVARVRKLSSPVGAEGRSQHGDAPAGARQAVLVSGELQLEVGVRGRAGTQQVVWMQPRSDEQNFICIGVNNEALSTRFYF